ncbi:MAG: hypothetical protein A2Z14_05220 [Chloroflexi bacterium RBG_16_48_8]|nr:MAG: hypothetical protein A2Z14_05220 [Chloroflexi bacterium RBG_16_48_8]
MPTPFEADVALIHIAGGSSRTTPPPGTIAQAAPRRAARGRSDDLLFLNLSLHPDHTVAPGLTAHLAHLGADAYYGTAGSVTLGLRETATIVNEHLLDANQAEMISSKLQGRLLIGILRDNSFYVAQCGPGQVILVRSSQVTRLSSEDASKRLLGVSSVPYIRYHHIEIQVGDILILTTAEPPIWSELILSSLAGLNPAQAVDRLIPDLHRDLTGMIIGVVAQGEAAKLPRTTSDTARPESTRVSDLQPQERRPKVPVDPGVPQKPSWLQRFIRRTHIRIRSTLHKFLYGMAKIGARLSPGLSEPSLGSYPPKFLALTAITIPLVVVTIASLVYFRFGRNQQFQLNLADARAAIAAAETKETLEEAREDYLQAQFWLEQAARYGTSDELTQLQDKVQSTLDNLDLIVRLEFSQIVSGGFGPESHLTSLAASAMDLYVLDEAHGTIWHVWSTGRGFEIDGEFKCLQEAGPEAKLTTPVDIAIVPEPSALGVESLIGIDAAGFIIYCAPDKIPTTAELAPPELGWGRIQTFEVYNNRLYVLDSDRKTIFIYDASNGFISGNPSSYFSGQPPDLSSAIDIAGSQDGLLILYADGHLDLCKQVAETDPTSDSAIRTDCETLQFRDERVGHEEEAFRMIPGALPMQVTYSPPPEPSLYFQDTLSGGVYQYSLRMIYQTQFIPQQPFDDEVSAFSIGPPNHLYIAAGNQIYHAQLVR